MFNQQTADSVCEALKEGASLRKAAEGAGIAPSTVLLWRDTHEAFAEQYARARAIGYEVEFEDLTEKAAEEPPTTNMGSTDTGWVAWKRLQVDTAKWALSKKLPKKYGDKLELSGDPDRPLKTVTRIELVPLGGSNGA